MSIFTKQYWKDSINNFKNIKSIVLMSIFMGMCVAVGGYFPIKIFGRYVSLLFIFWPIIGFLFGPIPTMIIAGVVDLLVFFLFPTGYPMYIGYTFTQMLIGFLNGIFFYKVRISILKIFSLKLIINFVIHVFIESIFWADINNLNFAGFKAYMITGAIKNGMFLPFETIIMVLVMIAMLPVFRALKLGDEKYLDKVHIF